MKHTLRTKFILFFSVTSIVSIVFLFLIVNGVINARFQQYAYENQKKRNVEIVQYFEQVYLKEKKWSAASGKELMHRATMEGYVISLLDNKKDVIWEMDRNMMILHHRMMGHTEGKYSQQVYPIQVEKKTVGYIAIGQYEEILFSAEDLEFKKSLRIGVGFSFVVSMLVSLLIAVILSKQLSKPIINIQSIANSLKQGNYDARVKMQSDTIEIEDLKNSINHLGISLQEQELLRKQLTSDVSHELRTPLNVLLSQMEAFIDGIWEPTPERLQGCHEEILRLTDLVKELEKLTSLEKQDVKLNMETICLNDVIKGVVLNFQAQFYQKGIQLHFEDGEKIYIEADKSKINQVLINILSNAYKFTNKGGEVSIHIQEQKGCYRFIIKDDGQGMKKQDLPRIFERFYRGEKSRNRKTGGAGIGLTIVKKIIEAHRWKIFVESEEEKGTTVTVEIPKQIV